MATKSSCLHLAGHVIAKDSGGPNCGVSDSAGKRQGSRPVTYTIKTHIRGEVAGYTLSWWQVLKGIFEGGRGQRMRWQATRSS
jgi:hypothetical protein